MKKSRFKYGLVTSLLIFPLLALSQNNIEIKFEFGKKKNHQIKEKNTRFYEIGLLYITWSLDNL